MLVDFFHIGPMPQIMQILSSTDTGTDILPIPTLNTCFLCHYIIKLYLLVLFVFVKSDSIYVIYYDL